MPEFYSTWHEFMALNDPSVFIINTLQQEMIWNVWWRWRERQSYEGE